MNLNPTYKKKHNNQKQISLVNNQNSLLTNPEKDINYWLHKVKEFTTQKQWNKASRCYRKLIKLKPDNPTFYLHLGNILKRQGKTNQTINLYQQALALNPQKPAIFYEKLGDSFFRQYQFSEALENYQKVLEIVSDASPILYANVGMIYYQKQEWAQAVNYFQQALTKKPSLSEKVYLQFREALLKQNDIKAAEIVHFQFLEGRYLVDNNHKIVYCPISKNATTSFRRFLVNLNAPDIEPQKSDAEIFQYSQQYRINNFPNLSLNSLIDNSEYFKLLILRNPFNRLVSGYLNKIASCKKPEPFAQRLIEDVYQFLGLETNIKKSITFAQFIHYLTRTDDFNVNHHWRSQHTFIGIDLHKFDLIGKMEEIKSISAFLEEKFKGLFNNKPSTNSTKYATYKPEKKFHDYYPPALRILDGFPKTQHFYTPELEALVRTRYAQDIELYETQFNIKLESFN